MFRLPGAWPVTPLPPPRCRPFQAPTSSYNVIPLVGLNVPVVANGNVTITWGGAGKLQESGDLLIWTDVPGTPVSPYTAPAAGRKFYRLAP